MKGIFEYSVSEKVKQRYSSGSYYRRHSNYADKLKKGFQKNHSVFCIILYHSKLKNK